MRPLILFIQIALTTNILAQSKDLTGAYLTSNKDTNTLYLIIHNYISITSFTNDMYLGTVGGPIRTNKNHITISIEFNDINPENVGSIRVLTLVHNDKNKLYIDGNKVVNNNKIKQDLDGLWRITGRQSGQLINDIPISDRKTIKLLVDGYFQWIAINPVSKNFYGTGGGRYTYQNGKYTEQILFFSRDNSRVGHSLTFEGTVKDEKWLHSGKSSKGDPIFEIWTLENNIKKSSLK